MLRWKAYFSLFYVPNCNSNFFFIIIIIIIIHVSARTEHGGSVIWNVFRLLNTWTICDPISLKSSFMLPLPMKIDACDLNVITITDHVLPHRFYTWMDVKQWKNTGFTRTPNCLSLPSNSHSLPVRAPSSSTSYIYLWFCTTIRKPFL